MQQHITATQTVGARNLVNLNFRSCRSSDNAFILTPGASGYGTNDTHWALQLPTGETYTYDLDSLSEITKIVYPSGGYTKYVYQNVAGAYVDNNWLCYYDVRQIQERHVCSSASGSCGSEDVTTYSPNMNGTVNGSFLDGNITIDVTDPYNNRTRHTFSENGWPQSASFTGVKETDTTYYSGQGTPMRTVHMDYFTDQTGNLNSCSQPSTITTSLLDASPAQVSHNDFQYLSIPLIANTTVPLCGTLINLTDEIVSKKEYGFDGQLARTTTESWLSSTPSGAHILDRVVDLNVSSPDGSFVEDHQTTYDSRGNLTGDIRSGTSAASASVQYTPDSYGRQLSVLDADNNTTTYGYDPVWNETSCIPLVPAFPTTITNAANQSTSVSYNSCTGTAHSKTDPNGNTTSYSFDAVGRTTDVISPDGGETRTLFSPSAGTATTTSTRLDTRWITSVVNHDGLGREIQRQNLSAPEGAMSVDTNYDARGLVASVSNPYVSAPTGVTSFAYDPLGRKTLQCNQDNGTAPASCAPGSSFKEWDYAGTYVDFYDEVRNHGSRVTDALGRLTDVWEPSVSSSAGVHTSYTYNIANDLTGVIQSGTGGESPRVRSFTYDGLSRLSIALNPESGAVCYGTWAWGWVGGGACQHGYDGNGNLLAKTDARGQLTSYQYDALNRLSMKSQNGNASVLYAYDGKGVNGSNISGSTNGIGRLSQTATSDGLSSTFGYDQMGRVNLELDCNQSGCNPNATAAHYDAMGNVLSLTYPSGRTVSQSFDNAGRLNANGSASPAVYEGTPSSPTATYVSAVSYNPDGTQLTVRYGNGLIEGLQENVRLQRCKQIVQSGSQTVLDKRYFYGSDSTVGNECTVPAAGNNGNIRQIVDGLPNASDYQSYMYDSLNRLTQWNGLSPAGVPRAQRYSYDSFGNMAMVNGTAFPTISGMYDQNNRLTSIPCSQFLPAGVGSASGYDGAGNVVCQGTTAQMNENGLVYDAESRLTTIYADSSNNTPGLAAKYYYDGSGSRARAEQYYSTNTGSVLQSWRAYSYFGGQVLSERDQNNAWTDYIYANGKKVARVVGSGTATNTVPVTTTTTTSSYGGPIPTGGALHLQGSVTSTEQWAGQSFMIDVSGSLQNYTIIAGDKLVMRQKQAGNVQGGIPDIWADCVDPSKGGNQYLTDQDGKLLMTSSVHNAWQLRVFDLTQAIGCNYVSLRLGPQYTANTGPWEMWIADIALVHADGTQIPIFTSTNQVGFYAYGQPSTELGASMVYVPDSPDLEASSPDGALHMSGNVTSTGLFAGQSWLLDISGSLHNYTIRSGDVLVLRQQQAQGVQGAFLSMWADCANTANTHNQYLSDQNGQLMEQSTVYGVWQERTFDLTQSVNCVPASVRVGQWQSAATGQWDLWLGDMLIRSQDGRETPIYAGWWQAGAYQFENMQPATELGGTAVYDPTAVAGGPSGSSGSGSSGSGSSGSGSTGSSGASGSSGNGSTTTFYITDHLGTASLEFDSSGTLLWQGEFAPFGGELDTQSTTNRYKFTGKERDTESGLDYFGARYYGSSMGRFSSPDYADEDEGPVSIPNYNPSNPQSLNLYSYVRNNPLTNTDPDGHDCVVQSRVDSNHETVSVSTGNCDGVKLGSGQSATYVPGTVTGYSANGGNSLDIGYNSYDGQSSGVTNAKGAPAFDHPGIDGPANAAIFGQIGNQGMGAIKAFTIGSAVGGAAGGAILAYGGGAAALTTLGDLSSGLTAHAEEAQLLARHGITPAEARAAIEAAKKAGDVVEAMGRYGPQLRYTANGIRVVVATTGRNAGKIITAFFK